MDALRGVDKFLTDYYEKSKKLFPSLDSNEWIEHNTTAYKVSVIVCHFFRTLSMVSLIHFLPYPKSLNCMLSLGMSTFYWVVIEKKNCGFNFSVISCFGAMALDASAWGMYAIATRVAFVTTDYFAKALIQTTPFILYALAAIWLTNKQVNEKALELQGQNDCCKT